MNLSKNPEVRSRQRRIEFLESLIVDYADSHIKSVSDVNYTNKYCEMWQALISVANSIKERVK